MQLVLSLFPGVGLLDRAFELSGFCVVRGPDKLWGGDVRRFRPPPGKFWGIIAGSPCQDFSAARRAPPGGSGAALLAEFRRVVIAAAPEWWLLENVARVPDVSVPGYTRQRLDVNQAWWSGVRRLRHVQFGSRSGRLLDVPRGRSVPGAQSPALACDGRSFREVCRLQSLPDDFELPGFTVRESIRAVGNGVPLVMGRVLARAVLAAYGDAPGDAPAFNPAACARRRCGCGCGRVVRGRARYAGPTCRKRAERARNVKHLAARV